MSAVIEWSDPPPVRTRSRTERSARWDQIAAELKARPGQWAKVAEAAARQTGLISTIKQRLAPRGEFEVVTRFSEGVGTAWARYIGPTAAPAASTSGTFPDVKSNVVALPPAKAVPHPSTQPAPKLPARDPFECELCDPPKVFTNRHSLRHHQRVSHRGAS